MQSTESQWAIRVLLFTWCNNSAVALGDYKIFAPNPRGYCEWHARIEQPVSRQRRILLVFDISFPLKVWLEQERKRRVYGTAIRLIVIMLRSSMMYSDYSGTRHYDNCGRRSAKKYALGAR